MKFLSVFFLAAYLMLPVILTWSTDFNKAKTEALSSKKLILLSFSGSDWCIPCIKMKKEIFQSDAFEKFAADNLVLVNADFPRLKKNQLSQTQTKQNEDLADKYNQEGTFPCTVLMDANGKALKRWDSLPKLTPEAFTKEIAQFKK
jgi:thioredoxin-related protein